METIINTLYGLPPAPPRTRTGPMRILCVGLPRSGTESLSLALTRLGYKTFHGWDLVFDDAPYIQAWAKLVQRKYATPGDDPVTREEFDALLGPCDVVIDSAPALFTSEIIQAYPEAKVILNTRRDVDAWHCSAMSAFVDAGSRNWGLWWVHLFEAELFWLWRVYYGFGYPGLFGGRNTQQGLLCNGKRVYREHGFMVRGMVPSERLLEWNVEDGWAPLCEFLGKDVPDEPFPRTNNGAGFVQRVEAKIGPRKKRAFMNMALTAASVGVLGAAIVLGNDKRSVWWPVIQEVPAWIKAKWV
ncbi:sulfotransferase family protein [Aspergillus homomorphus CBS 101889]|uniref:NAD dependent epimerase/dehydratase n=1 Tax=Aspergillus homomorphus (strain CBS 101889) TaxID=1450537 RepID=A0A395HQK6_ASPHC|nr:hypothetical protein BO97DRAFT_407115 [Aspergillus homomorphus CBS 101889]RAL10231.1 hypothetical protein BO97DRAFT_407115 [Aspergillus homomorphus CBS 101889]